MLNRIVADTQIQALCDLVNGSRKVAIVCHMTPDGDAMGSSLCLWHVLKAMGKTACVVTPDCPPESMMFLPGADKVLISSYNPERTRYVLGGSDLIFCLDFNDLKRIDRTAPMVADSKARRIVVDHHLNPSIDADVLISHPEKSSTCALLYMVLSQAGWSDFIGKEAAECCCTGMMTDTGNFSYNSNDADLYEILAQLVAKGVDKDAIYTRVFNTNSVERLRIMGYSQYAKMQLLPEHRAALITLSREELNEFNYKKGDTEALVNVPLSIPEIVYSIYLREDEPNYVKVSMRSKGDFSVKDICERHFGGGGHRNAAGGEVHAGLDEALNKVLEVLPIYDPMLPANDEID